MPPRYTIHDVLTAYDAAPTPILREAVSRWLSEFVLMNRDGLWHDDPAAVRRATDIMMRRVGETMRLILHPDEAPEAAPEP
jgi:hypothetical protein